jgi:hypothetical protein
MDVHRLAYRPDICFLNSMSRGLIRTLLVTLVAAPLTLHGGSGLSVTAAEGADTRFSTLLQRFLSLDDPSPSAYRALRHLEASEPRLRKAAWMDVWAESDEVEGFRYTVVAQGGSGFIRSKVFLASLETEKKMYQSGAPAKAAMTPANYLFAEGTAANGLSGVAVTPRRKDILLIDGSIFLRPEDGELMRIEGRLSKAPSFWVRQVEIVQSYRRIAGVRMPVAVDAVANLFLAGRATFRMTYEYESVNGQRVGDPESRLAKASS